MNRDWAAEMEEKIDMERDEAHDDSSLETERVQRTTEMHMSLLVDECLMAVRVDLENCDLDPVADTAARMALEMFSRLWYERSAEC